MPSGKHALLGWQRGQCVQRLHVCIGQSPRVPGGGGGESMKGRVTQGGAHGLGAGPRPRHGPLTMASAGAGLLGQGA